MTGKRNAALQYSEGDRCSVCGHWYWERDHGWHSLIPMAYVASPGLGRFVFCPQHFPEPPTAADLARGAELAEQHGW